MPRALKALGTPGTPKPPRITLLGTENGTKRESAPARHSWHQKTQVEVATPDTVFTNPKTTNRVVLVGTITKKHESRPCGITIIKEHEPPLAWLTILNWKIMGTVMRAPHMSGRPPGWCLTVDGADTTRRFSYTSNRRFGAASNRSASWRLVWAFCSANRRIRDLRPANDAARRAAHDGTICFVN